MFKVIYLTGAPASGKTTTVDLLTQSGKQIEVWSYSDRLKTYLAQNRQQASHVEMREQSSTLITSDDIAAVDEQLIAFISERRGRTNIIIDSHPVTKESYGFRVTAFSIEQLQRLAPDEIWMTFASADDTVKRIEADRQGRQPIDAEAAAMHTHLQAAVATTYGILCSRPVYIFDSGLDVQVRVDKMISRLG
jgi:adenylate kinase